MNKLQKALLTNAVFSGTSGLILLLFQHSIARLFGVENTTIFEVTGLLLLFFAGTILYEARKQRRLGVWWIITQDILWVIGSAILLILQPFAITATGNIVIAIIALIVLLLAVMQTIGLKESSK